MSILAAGAIFLCTPTLVYDGDGPIHCAEGPRLRLAGIAARERDNSCNPGHPCPKASGADAVRALVTILGGPRGTVRYGRSLYAHVRVQAPTMRCLSTGNAKGQRTGAFCTLATGQNLNCLMLASGTVVRWDRYWRRDIVCPRW